MKKIYFVLSFLTISIASAQKSAPVAGDAATLLDLLQKDYNSINPENLDDELAKDRSKVIAIFKSYTKDAAGFEKISVANINNKKDFLASTEAYNNMLKRSELSASELSTLSTLKSAYDTNKKIYYTDLNTFDKDQFDKLITHFNGLTPKNAYLSFIVGKFKTKYTTIFENKADVLALNNSNSSIQKGLPFAGGDILVKGIDGLARVIADNIKKEIVLNIMENLQEYLKNKKDNHYLYELEVLLPTTVDYLKNFDADQLVKFSVDLQQYIESDLKLLVPHSVNLRNTPRVAALIQKYPDLDFALEGLEVLDKITKIKSPVDYFEVLENSRNINRWRSDTNPTKKGIAQGLRLASMLAYSLSVIENNEVKFVTSQFISNYGSQPNFGFLYFGLLHQQNINYFDLKYNGNYFTQFVDDTSKINQFQSFINAEVIPIVENAERIHNQFTSIKKKNKNNEKVPFEEMHQLIDDVLNFGQEITVSSQKILTMTLNSTDLGNTIETVDKIKAYFTIGKLANSISFDLYEKRYTNAISTAIEIPITLNNLKGNASSILQNSKIGLDTFYALTDLKEILSLPSSLSDAEKLASWTNKKNKWELIAVRLQENASLKPVADQISTFITNVPTANWNQANYDHQKGLLEGVLNTNKDKIYSFLGIDTEKIKSDLESKLKEKKMQQSTITYITGKLTAYHQNAFDSFLLGKDTAIDAESELIAAYEAFLPELLNRETIKSNTKLVKIIHFINDVAHSDTPEEYKKAIEAFVLPVGSSSLKEKSSYYFSLNSFPGLLGGIEKSDGIQNAGFIGFTAPVGLYFQMGANKNRSTWGLFMPIIDIAAPVRLRLDNANDTKTLPDFEFDDIFSPGIYLVYGIQKSPLAFNLGLQYGPKLRDIPTEDTSSFTSVESYRIGLGVTLDIPLLTLSSKYKNE